jgi:peptidoglycan hydrolase CwlO-like protein
MPPELPQINPPVPAAIPPLGVSNGPPTAPQNPVNQQMQTEHAVLKILHADLTADHEQLKQNHDQAVQNLAQAQQQAQALEEQKQNAEAQIQGLLAQVTELTKQINVSSSLPPDTQKEISALKEKLTAAETQLVNALATIRKFEDSPIGQATRPLWSRLVSWLVLPVLGSIGGAFLGIHTPINPYRTQAQNQQKQTPDPGPAMREQVDTANKQLEAVQQELNTERQNNAQLLPQVTDLNKNSQSMTSQLLAAQKQLETAKSTAAREHADAISAQQQFQAEHAKNQQLASVAASATAMREIIERHPFLNYKGPTQGVVTVTFKLHNDKPADIVIDQFHASGPSNVEIQGLAGLPFPNIPQIVQPMSNNVTIVAPPNQNSWQKITISVRGKGQGQAVLRWSVIN